MIPQHPVFGQGNKTDNLMRILMNKSNQHSPYRLTGESVKNYHINNKQNKKLTLIDKLILLFGGLFIFYFLTLIIK
ncbi:hypothetical protein [Arsenophonus nasoniae]|uniref:Uncharacterized protein n=3 Tax=Arsenophonus nasoniae TaxID=638 RepID=A0AA95GSI2_9GAMM|nr:hypothetical protein [Arsenophonus nasoniae]WGM03987.1 hypothetical protein QE210_21380 [Arsenophonus nasoniae]